MITIHRKNEENLNVSVSQGSVRKYNLMKEDYVKLKFSLDENMPLLIGDYVDLTDHLNSCDNENFHVDEVKDETTKLFILNRNYYPKYNKSTGGWDYEVQFDAYYKMWKNKIFKFVPDNGEASPEASFTLTDNIEEHVKLLLRNLKAEGYKYGTTDFNYVVESDVTAKGMKTISYSSIDIFSAVNLIASTYECEWWVDGGSTIWFGFRNKEENKLSLTINSEIDTASTSNSENVHATRLYAFGGTTNVPKNYRNKLEFTVSEAGSNYILDSKKQIRPWMFTKMVKPSEQTKSFMDARSDSTDLMSGDTYLQTHELTLGTLDLTPQQYHMACSLNPRVLLRKLLVKGDDADQFTINFDYSFKLVYKDDVVDLHSGVGSIKSTVYDMAEPKYTVSVTDDIYSDNYDNKVNSYTQTGQFSVYNPYGAVCIASTVRTPYPRSEVFSPFYRPKDKDWAWGSIVQGDEIEPLVPITDYAKGQLYTLLLQDYPNQGSIITYGARKEKRSLYYSHNKKWFDIDKSDVGVYNTPKYNATYTLVFSIKTKSATGLSWRHSADNYSLVYDVQVPSFKLTYRKNDAESASTKLIHNGNEYDVVVNFEHDYRGEDDVNKVASGNLGSSKIKMTTPLKVGDKFTLPYILRSKVPSLYFEETNSGLQSAVVQRNIMLPEGKPYVQYPDDLDDAQAIESIVVYDWIYPKTPEKVTKVDYPIKYKFGEDENGKAIEVDTYNITLGIKGFVWENMVTDNGSLYAIFQNGKAAGLRFELKEVQEKDVDLSTRQSVTFTLIPNEDYSVVVPNAATVIKTGDEVVLDGINVQYFDENAVEKAENEVLKQAEADIVKMAKEDKVVDITLRSDYAYNKGRLTLGSIVDLHGILSSRVDENDNPIPYESRIIGFEEKLDIPYDSPKYIIGESNYYSTIGSIETRLNEVSKGSFTLAGVAGSGSGSSVHIIKSGDNTKPTENNVYSAKRTEEQFLNKNEDSEVKGNITFKKDISVDGTSSLNHANIAGDLNVQGSTDVESLNVRRNANIEGAQTIGDAQEVKGLQTLHKGFVTKNFNDAGGQIIGAQLTENGIFTVAGLKAMSFEVFELIYNTIKAQGGKFVFSNSANVESCRYLMTDGTILPPDAYDYNDWGGQTWIDGIDYVYLKLKEDDAAKSVPFVEGDIIYGYVTAIGESGQYARGGQCVMYVVNPTEEEALDEMGVKAKLYPIGDTSTNEGVVASNIPPTDGMAIAQRGNIDPKNHPDRLTSFFVDCQTSNLYMLSNVTTPTLSKANYAVVSGQLPTDLYNEVVKVYSFIKPYDPVSYAKYGIFENILQFDHLGQPIKRENNRGEWDAKIAAKGEYSNTESYYDTVTYNGELWKCVADGTTDTPGQGNGWLLLVSKGADGEKGKDGVNGKDGMSPNPNLLQNSNFDVTELDGNTLKTWKYYDSSEDVKSFVDAQKSVCVKEGEGLGFNAVYKKVENGGAMFMQSKQMVNLQPNTKYTLSCYSKYEGDKPNSGSSSMNSIGYGIVFSGTSASKIKVISASKISGSNSNSSASNFEIYFGVDWGNNTNWVRHTITFEVTEAISSIGLRFHVWASNKEKGNTYYYSQPKIEVGSEATPYQKAQDDLKGEKGADGKDGKSIMSNILENTNFERVEDGIPVGWQKVDDDKITLKVVKDDYKGLNSLELYKGVVTAIAKGVWQTVSGDKLDANKWYTFSFYCKASVAQSAGSTYRTTIEFDGTTGSTYLDGVEETNSSEYRLIGYTTDWEYHRFTFKPNGGDIYLGFGAPRGSSRSFYFNSLKLELCQDQDNPADAMGTEWEPSAKDKIGIAGPAGESGAMLYPYGNWQQGAEYTLEYDDKGNVVGKPMVYYKAPSSTEGTYYILKKDVTGSVAQDMTEPDLEYWTAMTRLQYIYTEAIMANFAKFGSDKGAVFYEKYLFSQFGHNNVHYAEVGQNNIFDKNGDFTGVWIPKLHLDFFNGLANISCLCEPYNTPNTTNGVMQIDMDGGFNVKIPYPSISSITSYNPSPIMPLVVLPNFGNASKWAANGSHVTIMFEAGGANFGKFVDQYEETPKKLKSLFVLVCVNNPVSAQKIGVPSATWNDTDSYIFHKGRRAKYAILGVGATLKLKATAKGSAIYWYVENEGSVTEEKVDIYSSKSSVNISSMGNISITSSNYNRIQFYGADYSTLVNLKEDYHGENIDTRGLMLYTGPEGLCPRNIVFTYNTSSNEGAQYRIAAQSEITASGFTSSQGPILAD